MQLVLSHSAGREAAVSALALLTSSSNSMAAQCTADPQWQHGLLLLLKHQTPATRLAACICLQNICAELVTDGKVDAAVVEV